jgi:phosphoribosylglycinamide formyltransferase-1
MTGNDTTAQHQKKHIAIFASGAGSNAQKIIDHFRASDIAAVVLIVCNNPNAKVIEIAKKENIPVLLIERKKFNEDGYLQELKIYQPDLIVLAGFLWKIPPGLVQAYPDKIINIHPALLPKYGGKNMYGNAVHQAVINSGDPESGITIHYVDEIYDNGKIIFQAKCSVDENENALSLADKIHVLEHAHYPAIIEKLLK